MRRRPSAAVVAAAAVAVVAGGRRAAERRRPSLDQSRPGLDSGLRVVTETLPALRSVTLGAWVGSGARDETDEDSGASHFLEHLLFKGTEDRAAREIAEAIESVGGEMNAFTTHEQTVFYVRVPDTEFAARVRHPRRHRVAARVPSGRGRVGAAGHPRGDRDARRHARRPRARTVRSAPSFLTIRSGAKCSGSESTITAMTREQIAAYPRRALPPFERGARRRPATSSTTRCSSASRRAFRIARRPGRRASRPALAPAGPIAVTTRSTEQAHVVFGMRALAVARSRPVRVRCAEPGARWRHVVTTVPVDPRGARPRVLRLLVPRRVRGLRIPRDLCRHCARSSPRDARCRCAARSTSSSAKACPRARLDAAEGPPHGIAGDGARDVVEPHASHRPGRAGRRRGPRHRRR